MEKIMSQKIQDFKVLAEAYAFAAASLSGENGELVKHRNELSLYKKIIGNYHPTDKSPTYRELMDKNKNHEAEAASHSGTIQRLKSENAALNKARETQEREILLLRKSVFPKELPAREKKKGRHRLARSSRKKKDAPPLSEDEKKSRLREHLLCYHRHYSDQQTLFLAKVLSDDVLPADEMARLFDPTMTSARMEQFYKMLCAKHHIPFPKEIPQPESENGADRRECTEAETAETTDSSAASAETSPHPVTLALEFPIKAPSSGIAVRMAEKLSKQRVSSGR